MTKTKTDAVESFLTYYDGGLSRHTGTYLITFVSAFGYALANDFVLHRQMPAIIAESFAIIVVSLLIVPALAVLGLPQKVVEWLIFALRNIPLAKEPAHTIETEEMREARLKAIRREIEVLARQALEETEKNITTQRIK